MPIICLQPEALSGGDVHRSKQLPVQVGVDVCLVGNLRAEKDPFRCTLAAGSLPSTSRIRITHAGKAHSEKFAGRTRALASAEPRCRWLGEVPQWRVRRLLSRARLLEQTETDATFHELLKARFAARRPLTLPERERAALDALLKEVGSGDHNPTHESSHQVY